MRKMHQILKNYSQIMGDDSYGSSWAETHATVVETESTTTPTSSTIVTQEPVGLYIAASTVAKIIAVALVGLMLKNRPITSNPFLFSLS